QKRRRRRFEHYEIMVKEIYHTTRLGIQTGFGVIGIAISFCRRSFYYLDFFDLAILFASVVFFWGGRTFFVNLFTVFCTNVVGIRFVERLDQRDPATQNHRAHTVAIFTFFPTSFVENSFGGMLMCCSIGRREVLYDSRIMKNWDCREGVCF
ncbi:hypothetical protein V8C43DRAFT_281070, partial [Trichoderma afarasin]